MQATLGLDLEPVAHDVAVAVDDPERERRGRALGDLERGRRDAVVAVADDDAHRVAHAFHGAHLLAARGGLARIDAGAESGGGAEHDDQAGGEQAEAGGDAEAHDATS